ncbi:N-acetylglucosamine repressor [Botrimarina colliarenosi]|uniref:N-acetylglucosamine repressor n=1 Tax=Botrimarina colliarenosi TaxID=2528001 RepID=A0A5C6AF70_9BACT|nr:ROK family protein [Botrimarina colliarenosi]TWT97835.1 N-acetylglucosamine repressor [Botrimarina colliarenosi]
MSSAAADKPLVLTLDAGGTNFSFAALRGGKRVSGPYVLPSEANNLKKSLANLYTGFERVAAGAGGQVAAISFAFPGPADYAGGVIYNMGNLPAYADGVPLGDLLSERFGVPVLINNDGDLFALGEAAFGRLPDINRRLEECGSDRRYRNLIGLTLGTGFGGGIVVDGQLLRGDNGLSGEVWLLRHGFRPEVNAEEGISIRAITAAYATTATSDLLAGSRTPHDIARIAKGELEGDAAAAREAYVQLGRALGDAIATLITVLDGVVVIGGGLSQAHSLFMPAILKVLGGSFSDRPGSQRRLVQCVYNLESEVESAAFYSPDPSSPDTKRAPRQPRSAIALSHLGANEAVALGAYALALQTLGEA